ncbi:patatin-like phospholipase family protein [Rhodobacteraceae bacterium KMM 6894]|nr:patatin-like phospholipase family protein [Rhodobacteraceae bacterium KMM 6894]
MSPLDPANDPLARFRLFADDGADKWRQHLPSFSASDQPNVLALSGGGEDGAFGAGALAGWSASGTRPRLDLVTGVSTGALIAPFAFIGQERDNDLQRIFTEHDAGDIMRLRPVQAAFGDALYDTTPLAELIAEYTPTSVLQTVADRHTAGARLFIVTSELDSARASVWDMGAIAEAGQYDLFRNIMRGSAALPGLFSPVNLRYVANGKTYSETHIDGGVHMQFLALPDFAFTNPQEELAGGHVHLLINNTLNPAPEGVTRSAMSISQQALTTTGRANAQLAVNATQLFAREHGMKLSVASIDPASGIVYDPSDRFSSTYMNALYRHGYQRGVQNALWTEKA